MSFDIGKVMNEICSKCKYRLTPACHIPCHLLEQKLIRAIMMHFDVDEETAFWILHRELGKIIS